MKGIGYLQSYIGTAVTSLPIQGAKVCVYDKESGAYVLSLVSDADGMIYRTPLPTPQRTDAVPYVRYRAIAQAQGYESTEMEIAFFDGVTSYQTFLLTPKKDEK